MNDEEKVKPNVGEETIIKYQENTNENKFIKDHTIQPHLMQRGMRNLIEDDKNLLYTVVVAQIETKVELLTLESLFSGNKG